MSTKMGDILSAVRKSLDFRRETEIFGIKFELGVLSLEEERRANNDEVLSNLEGTDYLVRLEINVLSYSIKSLNGTQLDSIVEVEESDKSITKKEKALFIRELLETLPTGMINELFEVYSDIKEEAEEKLKSNTKCVWYKTPDVRQKEMEERIKKYNEEEKRKIELREIPKEPEPEEELGQEEPSTTDI
jgi:small-conductance mechanosensitive channel